MTLLTKMSEDGVAMTIEIKEYSKVIKKATILENINISMYSGNVYGLRGVNGSGKTMLLRAICGLIYPTGGMVTINDEVLGRDISFPRSVGVLIENPAFLPNYTGFKNLQLIASLKKAATDEMIEETLSDVGLNPKDKRTFRKYSLGMKQKLGIAAAIMEQPDLIILDEPFNALDDDSVEKVKQLIRREKDRGALIILACHDRAALSSLSDQIIYLSDGRIIKIEDEK